MNTYALKYNNGKQQNIKAKNLTDAQAIVVAIMNDFEGIVKCEITTPSGALSFVRKDGGSEHWNHPGYSFSMVSADQVSYYRKLNRD